MKYALEKWSHNDLGFILKIRLGLISKLFPDSCKLDQANSKKQHCDEFGYSVGTGHRIYLIDLLNEPGTFFSKLELSGLRIEGTKASSVFFLRFPRERLLW